MRADSDKKPFKVVIVGGGFAGLSLAIMLEMFDIDYVLLEARGEIASAIGAGIAMCPNGNRILDQIGCFEPLLALGLARPDKHKILDADGTQFFQIRDAYEHYEKRLGYPLLFVDRPSLVQILYNKILKKDNIFVNKRVSNIELQEDGVRVHSADGQVFNGSIVVGADGIYSAVRESMYRIAKEVQPGYFPENPSSKVPCYYYATFGTAKDVPDLVLNDILTFKGNHFSYYVFPGHNGQVYYLLDEKHPEVKYGDDIQRRFTPEEEEVFVKKYAETIIKDKVRFKDIHNHRIMGGMTSLHHTVYDQWSFRRILVIGDSAHKSNPGTGMGANLAFESAAELVNGIMKIRKERPLGLNGLDDSHIEKIMQYVESSRIERAKKVVDESYEGQELNGNEKPLKTWIAYSLLPKFSKENALVDWYTLSMRQAPYLHDIPKPQRPSVMPFIDELPEKPVGEIASWLVWAAFGGGMGAVAYLAGKTLRLDITNRTLWANAAPIVRPWTTDKGFGRLLTVMASTFSDVIASQDLPTRVQAIYFLTQLVAPVLIWTIEGHRTGNQSNVLSLSTLFLSLIQLKGIGCIAPYWAFIHSCFNETAVHYRFVKTDVVKSLIPALTLGYIVPTALMVIPSSSVSAWQDWTALWQFGPPLVPILVNAFSVGLRWWKGLGKSKTEEEKNQEAKDERLANYTDEDVAGLKSAYSYATLIQATSHIVTLAYSYSHSDLSFGKIFCGMPNPFVKDWNLPSLAAEAAIFFKYDMALCMSAFATHNLYSIWQLRRDGYVRTRDATKAALAVVFGHIFIGPGATWTGLWGWREGVVAGIMRK